jgi:hypothetical protein
MVFLKKMAMKLHNFPFQRDQNLFFIKAAFKLKDKYQLGSRLDESTLDCSN